MFLSSLASGLVSLVLLSAPVAPGGPRSRAGQAGILGSHGRDYWW